jgi:molybdopterin-guanine dinucleotide biosynthesis protein A
MQITAIILAGGQSKRMGTDKALLELDGVSLLQNTINLCESISDSILISSNNPKHNKFGWPVISDEIKNCGPLGGIFTCLKKSKTDWNVVISVDAAFVKVEFLQFILAEISDVEAIVPFSDRGKEPLIALYNKTVLSAMNKKIDQGDFKMHGLLETINTKYVDAGKWLEKYPKLLHNINRPEDL